MEKNISRSSFLRMGAGTALSLIAPFNILSSLKQAPSIKQITVLPVPGEFYRPIAMNAYDNRPKGIMGETSIVRIILDDGTEGIGILGYQRIDEKTIEGLRRLIGKSPTDIYQWDGEKIVGFSDEYRTELTDPKYAFIESPILDALGKLRNKPVWQLFRSKVRSEVDCYDGTLYFKDIELDTGVSVLADLAKRIKEDGYKAIKMKVGRPSKWMPGEAGVERDIEAFKVVREAVGNNFNLMADANNGYEDEFKWALKFLVECLPHDMYWMEEIFPDSVEQYRRLHDALHEKNLGVRISEGENIQDIEGFSPYLGKNIYNIIQPDMRTVGFTNILRGSEMARQYGISLVPHNWQSEMGKIMSIHAAMIDKNISFAEDDRYDNFALDSSQYLFRDGQWIAPDLPGWGIQLNSHYEFVRDKNEELVIS
jgi:L-alanine-DL-glutamate epimerase-like enolase superfamily enzyme